MHPHHGRAGGGGGRCLTNAAGRAGTQIHRCLMTITAYVSIIRWIVFLSRIHFGWTVILFIVALVSMTARDCPCWELETYSKKEA